MAAAPRAWREVSGANLCWATFATHVNSRFLLRDANGQAHALDLIGAEPASSNFAETAGGEQFSLFFRGDATRPLRQNTYAFEHGGMGHFDMFIVPIGREDQGHCYYEAVFNRPALEPAPERRSIRRLRAR